MSLLICLVCDSLQWLGQTGLFKHASCCNAHHSIHVTIRPSLHPPDIADFSFACPQHLLRVLQTNLGPHVMWKNASVWQPYWKTRQVLKHQNSMERQRQPRHQQQSLCPRPRPSQTPRRKHRTRQQHYQLHPLSNKSQLATRNHQRKQWSLPRRNSAKLRQAQARQKKLSLGLLGEGRGGWWRATNRPVRLLIDTIPGWGRHSWVGRHAVECINSL